MAQPMRVDDDDPLVLAYKKAVASAKASLVEAMGNGENPMVVAEAEIKLAGFELRLAKAEFDAVVRGADVSPSDVDKARARVQHAELKLKDAELERAKADLADLARVLADPHASESAKAQARVRAHESAIASLQKEIAVERVKGGDTAFLEQELAFAKRVYLEDRAATSTFVMRSYQIDPSANIAELALDAPPPPGLCILDGDLGRVPHYLRLKQAFTNLGCQLSSTEYTLVGDAIVQLFRRPKSGSEESGLHARDDALLDIVRTVAPLHSERNSITQSTTDLTRPDAFLYYPGQPPVVMMEEKKGGAVMNIQQAVHDLTAKFVLTQHYNDLKFICGIAVAGDTVVIGELRQNRLTATQSYNLEEPEQAVRCAVALINVGRWCKAVEKRVASVGLAFFVLHETSTRNLRLHFTYVEKTYLKMSAADVKRLNNFYAATRRIRFIEKLIDEQDSCFRTCPIGVPYVPTKKVEARHAAACLLAALGRVHAAGWVILDLRWPNVITYRTVRNDIEWIIIDCEFARKIGEALPDQLRISEKHNLAEMKTVSPRMDVHSLGRMLSQVPQTAADADFEEFVGFLLADETPTVQEAQNHPFMAGIDWARLMRDIPEPDVAEMAKRGRKRKGG